MDFLVSVTLAETVLGARTLLVVGRGYQRSHSRGGYRQAKMAQRTTGLQGFPFYGAPGSLATVYLRQPAVGSSTTLPPS